MPPAISFLKARALAAGRAADRASAGAIICLGSVHLAAIAVMAWSEFGLVPKAAFILAWGLVNFAVLIDEAEQQRISLEVIKDDAGREPKSSMEPIALKK